MMLSAYKLNKQGDAIQSWCTPFPVLTISLFHICSNCCFLTCIQVSQQAGQVVWYSHLLKNFPQLVVIHTVKGFSVVTEAEVNVFLEFSCFSYGPTDVGSLTGLFKASLYMWNFSLRMLLKPSFFKHLSVCTTTNCGKLSKRWEYQTTWPASWEICTQVKKQQLELDTEQQTGSK